MDSSSGGSSHGLTYEETPVIEPVTEESTPTAPLEPPLPSTQPQPVHYSLGSTVGMIILFIILFVVGVGLSVMLRQYFATRQGSSPQPRAIKPSPSVIPSPYVNVLLSPTASPTAAIVDPYAGWKSYPVTSGATKQQVSGLSFKLPPEMLAPICDGTNCASQGTYLPNGSRFTVAPRGKGQLLVDARGNVGLTDSSGRSFTVKQVLVTGGRKALEYSGLFSGTTVGGYTFSQMRGLMIEIDGDVTLELNHFTPSGVSAEFVKDDVIFDKIVASLAVARFGQVTIPTSLTPILSPTRVASATPTQ